MFHIYFYKQLLKYQNWSNISTNHRAVEVIISEVWSLKFLINNVYRPVAGMTRQVLGWSLDIESATKRNVPCIFYL